MKFIRLTLQFSAAMLFALLLSMIAVTLLSSRPKVIAQEASSTQAKTSTAPEVTYEYVAQKGDSYTKMARKAIQTYGIKNKVSISPAEIIFAETNLTIKAQSPKLILGQKVSIKETDVKNWVDQATKLSPEKEAAWNVYVPNVDFNTNKVGQP